MKATRMNSSSQC